VAKGCRCNNRTVTEDKSAEELELQKAKLREALQGVLPTVTQDEINSHQAKDDAQFLADRPPHHDKA
jgi:hypothetical protein